MDLTTMPKIPSAAEISAGAGWGRHTDTRMAHVSNGEHLIPPEVLDANPELRKHIALAIRNMGGNPSEFVVGSPNMKINPITGQPEFFGGFIKKAIKKIAGSTLGKIGLTVAGTVFGGPLGGALANAAATKISGGSWGQAIGSGVGTYLGSSIGSSLFGTAGSVPASGIGPSMPATAGMLGTAANAGTVAGYSTVGNLLGSTASSYLPGAIADASLSTVIGSAVGSSYGSGIGSALIDGVQQPTTGGWGSESYNDTLSLPTSSTALATPGSASNAGDSGGTAGTGGAGINQDPGGVTYLTPTKDRNTGATSYKPNASFANSMSARRGGWGGSFANY